MAHIDRELFDRKCKEVVRDIKKGEATSPVWIWMTVGAALAFVASCLRIGDKKTNTTFKAERKAGDIHGKHSYFRDC